MKPREHISGKFFGFSNPAESSLRKTAQSQIANAGESPSSSRPFFRKIPPRLQQVEQSRRHSHEKVVRALLQTGFVGIVSKSLWETRKTYATFEQFADEMRNRSGRSILHELTDREIEELIGYIAAKTGTTFPVTDRDCWSVWIAVRPE